MKYRRTQYSNIGRQQYLLFFVFGSRGADVPLQSAGAFRGGWGHHRQGWGDNRAAAEGHRRQGQDVQVTRLLPR